MSCGLGLVKLGLGLGLVVTGEVKLGPGLDFVRRTRLRFLKDSKFKGFDDLKV